MFLNYQEVNSDKLTVQNINSRGILFSEGTLKSNYLKKSKHSETNEMGQANMRPQISTNDARSKVYRDKVAPSEL